MSELNDVAKQSICDKLLKAIETENLMKSSAASIIGMYPPDLSKVFNSKYWAGNDWIFEKVLVWINSGQTLRQYSKKRVDFLGAEPIKNKEVITPVKTPTVEPVEPLKEEPQRMSKGALIDLLLEERVLLLAKIDAIELLLKHYTS